MSFTKFLHFCAYVHISSSVKYETFNVIMRENFSTYPCMHDLLASNGIEFRFFFFSRTYQKMASPNKWFALSQTSSLLSSSLSTLHTNIGFKHYQSSYPEIDSLYLHPKCLSLHKIIPLKDLLKTPHTAPCIIFCYHDNHHEYRCRNLNTKKIIISDMHIWRVIIYLFFFFSDSEFIDVSRTYDCYLWLFMKTNPHCFIVTKHPHTTSYSFMPHTLYMASMKWCNILIFT